MADTRTVITIAFGQSESFVGMDDAGNFTNNISSTLFGINPRCGGLAVSAFSQCYETYYTGQTNPVFSTSAASLIYDVGSSCTPTPVASTTSWAVAATMDTRFLAECQDQHAASGLVQIRRNPS